MRFAAAAVILASCLATAAIAQSTAPPVSRWSEMPNARVFARAHPRRALNEGVSGYSLLCCAIRPDRTLDCEVAVDWPRGYGFDRAAQTVAREFVMSEQAYASLSSPDTRIRRGIVWQVEGRTPELQAALDQIHEATKTTCMPSGVEAEAGVDDIVSTASRIN